VVVLRPTGNGRAARGSLMEPPLAALTLAAWIRARGESTRGGLRSLAVLDAALEGWSLDQTCEQLVSAGPDLCVIDGEGANSAQLETLFQALGERLPEVHTVLVAGHASRVDQEALDLAGMHFAVHGDHQRPLSELLDGLSSGRHDFDGVAGLDWRADGGQIVRQEALARSPFLPPSPLPAWDLVDRARYLTGRPGKRREAWANLVTSRACPPACPTCQNAYGRVFRVRELAEVLEELRQLVGELGVTTVRVADELFNHDLGRAKAFVRGFLREAPGARLRLPMGLRPDHVDAEFAQLLAQAGVRKVTISIDSTAPHVQRLLRHNLDFTRVPAGVRHLAAAGIHVHGSFSMGWPEESNEQQAATSRFARRGLFHTADFQAATSDNVAEATVPLAGLSRSHRLARWATLRFYAQPTRLAGWSLLGSRRLRAWFAARRGHKTIE
jgi:anaerobic magnesium-protoporphyrin IX monomethyl ester cyclase